MTGLTSIVTELSEKYLELLLAAAPKLKRIGFLTDHRRESLGARVNGSTPFA